MSRANTSVAEARAPRVREAKGKRFLIQTRKTAKLSPLRLVRQASQLELAKVVHVDEKTILLDLASDRRGHQRASTIVPHADLEQGDRVVAVRLAGANPELVILGRLLDPLAPRRDVRVNGRKVTIEADSELVLKCAAATIRIARDGLVAIRGDRVVSQAGGTNRIRGGSVEIN